MKFTPLALLALSATVSSESLQKRDVSTIVDSIKKVNADFLAADNAIIGIGSQLNTTRQFLQSEYKNLEAEAVLSAGDTVRMLDEFVKLKDLVFTTMDHFGQRRDAISKSSDCSNIDSQLTLTFIWGSFYAIAVKNKCAQGLQPLGKKLGDDLTQKIKEQVDALKCT